MIPEQRRDAILEMARQISELKVEDIAARFGVSRETVRRDLARLDARGLLRRVHGGAHPPQTGAEAPFHRRLIENADAKARIEWDQCKAFARAVSELMRQDDPDRFTTTLAKKARGGKIFLDYLRNGRMATAVAPWSPRARPGAGIAFPLSWGQVKKGLDPRAFTLPDAPALLKKPDPWKDFRGAETNLRPVLKTLGV